MNHLRNALLVSAVFASFSPAQASLLVNDDFESGNTGFQSGYAFGNVGGPGTYTVASNASAVPGSYSDWGNFGDHTSGQGLFLIANGGNDSSVPVWSETVSVTRNTSYTFSFWGATLNAVSPSPADLALGINGVTVSPTNVFAANSPSNGGTWQNFTAT